VHKTKGSIQPVSFQSRNVPLNRRWRSSAP
jgi:hypothetical protein